MENMPKKLIKLIRYVLFFLISLVFIACAYYIIHHPSLSFGSIELSKPLNILLIGSDQVYDTETYNYKVKVKNKFNGRADTIIIFRFNPKNKTVKAINIPRDTRIHVNNKTDRMNVLNEIGGPLFLKAKLEELLNIKINKYIATNSQGFVEMIDILGGVDINVPINMRYIDKTDGLDINLQKGPQKLNGKQSLGFIRYRRTALGDIDRIKRQQQFLHAMQAKAHSPLTFIKAPLIISKAFEHSSTDLNFLEIFQLANFGKSIKSKDISFKTLPGTFNNPTRTETVLVSKEQAISGNYDICQQDIEFLLQDFTQENLDEFSKEDIINLIEIQETQEIETENEDGEPVIKNVEYVNMCKTLVNASYWLPSQTKIQKTINAMFN